MADKRHDDVAASIDATLLREARRNELLMARVRVGMLAAFSLVELIYMVQGVGVPGYFRLPVFAYFFVSLAFWRLLSGGWFYGGLWAAVPLLDTLVILARVQISFSLHSLQGLREAMELATVLGLSAVLVLSGAFRLSHKAVWASTLLGLFLYLWFALQCGLEWPQLITHAAIVFGVGGIALGLTSQVRRAVRSEVARVILTRFLPETVLSGAHADPIALLARARSRRRCS